MTQQIESVVAKTSPNLYAAAQKTNLSPTQVTQVQQMSYAIQENKQLNLLDPEKARASYDKLDSNAQKQLKFLFKDADYLQPPQDAGDKVMGVLKVGFNIVASPIVGLFKLAGNYNRLINTPYLVAREASQGADIFARKTWSAAWDGREVYDLGALKKAEDYFGIAKVEVAKGLLAGKTPGKIIEGYGKVDQTILDAITEAYNKPEDFRQVMDGVKYAQVSPGRDFARGMMKDMQMTNGGLHGDYINGTIKNVSGALDAMYQIVIDPLTWITGGSTKAANIGEKLAETVRTYASEGKLSQGIDKIFQDKRVSTLWDNQLGPLIKRYSEAPTKAEETFVYSEIARLHPGMANRDIINRLAKRESYQVGDETTITGAVVDAASAQRYFSLAKNTEILLSGSVDGMTYYRKGVPIARKERHIMDGLNTYLDSVFNATTSKVFGALKTAGRDLPEFEKAGNKVVSALAVSGETVDGLIQLPETSLAIIAQYGEQIKGIKNWTKVIGRLGARSPAGLEIRLGEKAAKTANNFTLVARQILPRDLAEFLTTHFIKADKNDQVIIVRNLYSAIIDSYGLHGTAKGNELKKRILDSKFGGESGFGVMADTFVNAADAKYAPAGVLKQVNGRYILLSNDAIQFIHSTDAIGPLPYSIIMKQVTEINSKKNLIHAIGGATHSKFVTDFVDAWSMLTLLPRLGIRSAIDEGLMFALTAPGRDLLDFATRKGHRIGKVLTTFTGSKESTGPVKEAINIFLKKIGVGSGNAFDAFTIDARQQLLRDYAKDNKIDIALLTNLQKRSIIANHVMDTWGTHLTGKELDWLMQGLKYSPDMNTSMVSAMVGASGLSGDLEKSIDAAMVTPSAVDLALKETTLKIGKEQYTISTSKLTDLHVALAQFEKWFKYFVGNKRKLAGGRFIDPAKVFFENKGLPDMIVGSGKSAGQHWTEKAINEMSEAIGVRYNPETKMHYIEEGAEEAVKDFLSLFSHTTVKREQEFSDADIVRQQVFNILMDLKTAFHGSGDGYNKKLIDAVRRSHAKLKAGQKFDKPVTYGQACAAINFKYFREITKDHRISGEVNTAIEFPGLVDPESLWKLYGNQGFEWMDRQITGIYRQPAIIIGYMHMRRVNAGIEGQWTSDMAKTLLRDHPERYAGKEERAYMQAERLGEQHFTELALSQSANTVLKYADNPAVRSNFAYSVRTVGRYYRATEDFQRRVFRMKEVPLRALYRMRLAHLGLSASGSVFNDANGDMYITMPMDNIIFKATDTTMRVLTGNTGYSQPAFNEFTMKLKMVNPSFQQDAGLPMLSGPVAGLGVIAIKNILGYTRAIPFIGSSIEPTATHIGNSIDQMALGNIGQNMNITRAIIPAGLTRIWALLPVNEQTRQEVTAAQQAMAYNAAHGLQLDPNSTDQEKMAYLHNIRISAHNVLFLRNLLSLISPATPTLQESKGVPDYLKRVGMTGLRPEFFDILNSISKVANGDVQDPYELALATFTGEYPGKLIYTVSRDSKQTRVVVKNTDGLKNWAIDNKQLINTYGEAAYIFAPQVGKFNAASYNWIQAAGLMQSKSLETYYNDLLVAQDKQSYYDIARLEKDALSKTGDGSLRANIIKQATDARAALKTSNPLLEAALIGQGNNIGNEGKLLSSIEQIIADPNTTINPATRQRMRLAIKMVKDFMTFATDPEMRNVVNFTELKGKQKAQIEADLRDLMNGDLQVTEANRAIFSSILSFYSRDSYVALKKIGI